MRGHWRFLDTGLNTGAYNMEFDETLAHELQSMAGMPTLRLFRWRPWAVSLGFNQDADEIDAAVCASRGFDIVRRPTGGRAILHAEELTYSVVMMPGRRGVHDVYNEISRALVAGLRMYGVEVSLQRSQPDFAENYKHPSSIPCFTSSARYEIEHQGKKLVGSAQRRYRNGDREVVLQHGSILTGPAHRQLIDCLALHDDEPRQAIKDNLEAKSTDLATICDREIDIYGLSACIKKGFEREWGIAFDQEERLQPSNYA